ncbi:fatty acid desaturase family protein [Nocardia callitridis]|uniref:Acyl-CoA desaturase n=1 Tax=Nocardia callitridis TaxID=648753 RepID=A0ABP9KRE9_9NOCA
MAITDVPVYAHLSADDIAALGAELDAVHRDISDSLGTRDAAYIRHTIQFQRLLDAAARLVIGVGRGKTSLTVGTVALATAKSIENMEIGHNVCHGQWDWMNDPEIHSATWEWDMVGVSSQWKHAHNYRHHVYTNVLGMDDDIGFGVMRVTRDQRWRPSHLLQPVQNLLLAATFEWGIAFHDLYADRERIADRVEKMTMAKALVRKTLRQVSKDYLVTPLLSGHRWRRTLSANAAANIVRNVWAYAVIFCGHFPDGAEKFTPEALAGETRAEWYLRQMLGTANFDAGRLMAFASGNLCYQIEHHLFPDLPSNRYAEIAVRVRALCDKYDLPYTTGPLLRQYLLTMRTIHKLALPDNFLTATSDDAPETASERKFADAGQLIGAPTHGLVTALRAAKPKLKQRSRRRATRVARVHGAGAGVLRALRMLTMAGTPVTG